MLVEWVCFDSLYSVEIFLLCALSLYIFLDSVKIIFLLYAPPRYIFRRKEIRGYHGGNM